MVTAAVQNIGRMKITGTKIRKVLLSVENNDVTYCSDTFQTEQRAMPDKRSAVLLSI